MWGLTDVLCRLLAPLLPHTADEAYRSLWKDVDGATERCVHLTDFAGLGTVAEADAAWPKVMDVRAAALKALEGAKTRGIDNPLDAEVVLADPDGTFAPSNDFVPSTQNAPGTGVDLAEIDPTSIDAFVLAEAAQMQGKVRAAYDDYEFRKAQAADKARPSNPT